MSPAGLRLRFHALEQQSALDEHWQILLGVVADFSILIGSRCLYSEKEFCVAEFALDLSRWLDQESKSGKDFIYESMESDEVGLVWIRSHGSGWRIGSVHQEYEEMNVFDLEEIRSAAKEFLVELENEMSARLGVRLPNLGPDLNASN